MPRARETSALLAATGATKLISAAVVDLGWSPRVALDDDAWRHVFESLGRIDDIAADAGLEHVLHPHANTIVELTKISPVCSRDATFASASTPGISRSGAQTSWRSQRAPPTVSAMCT